ncbi:uncharacterized protein [Euphorbia lathyris]|uniref:uncharacterized protein n=1 Tax=Euphorbia lathyris TaxID=212925 RepID=UPI0033132D92
MLLLKTTNTNSADFLESLHYFEKMQQFSNIVIVWVSAVAILSCLKNVGVEGAKCAEKGPVVEQGQVGKGRMSRTSSNSWVQGSQEEWSGPVRCNCGFISPLRTAKTPGNMGRRFFGCGRFKEVKDCNFFEWIDELPCRRGKMMLLALKEERKIYEQGIAIAQKRIEELEVELSLAKKMVAEKEIAVQSERQGRRWTWNCCIGNVVCLVIVIIGLEMYWLDLGNNDRNSLAP